MGLFLASAALLSPWPPFPAFGLHLVAGPGPRATSGPPLLNRVPAPPPLDCQLPTLLSLALSLVAFLLGSDLGREEWTQEAFRPFVRREFVGLPQSSSISPPLP